MKMALQLGYVESPLGRRRRLPDIRSKDSLVRGNAERMAMNQPISSASSDTVLLAGIETKKQIKDPREIRPILFVHDELVFEVKENKAEKWAKILKYEMENPPLERDFGYKMTIPLLAEPKAGENLSSLKPI